MEINHIECFLNVAKTLNFSEAARRSYISQSMVSRYIEKLEKELDAKLFVRSNREVELTVEGKTFLPYAVQIVDNIKKAKFAVNQLQSGYEGRIKILCDFGASDFATMCIREFSKKYPRIAIEIMDLHGEDIGLSDNGCDFVFTLRDMLNDGADIDYCITHEDTLNVVCDKSIDGMLENEILKQPLIILSETENPILYMEIMEIFHAKRITPKIVARPQSIEATVIALKSGIGISILPTAVAKRLDNYVKSYPMTDIETSLVYAAAWNSNSANPAVKLFLEIVKKYAGGMEYGY